MRLTTDKQELSAISAGPISMSLRDITSARMQALIVISTAVEDATKVSTLHQASLATRDRDCSSATLSANGTTTSLPSATYAGDESMT